jgi:hypothetical protein
VFVLCVLPSLGQKLNFSVCSRVGVYLCVLNQTMRLTYLLRLFSPSFFFFFNLSLFLSLYLSWIIYIDRFCSTEHNVSLHS